MNSQPLASPNSRKREAKRTIEKDPQWGLWVLCPSNSPVYIIVNVNKSWLLQRLELHSHIYEWIEGVHISGINCWNGRTQQNLLDIIAYGRPHEARGQSNPEVGELRSPSVSVLLRNFVPTNRFFPEPSIYVLHGLVEELCSFFHPTRRDFHSFRMWGLLLNMMWRFGLLAP